MNIQGLYKQFLATRKIFTVIVILTFIQIISAQKTGAQNFLEMVAQADSRMQENQWMDAAVLWEKIVKINPVEGRYWEQLGKAYYNAKDYRKSIANYEKQIALSYGQPSQTAYNISCNYALLEEKANALKWFEKAIEMGYADLEHAQNDKDLQSLRDDASFQKLVGLVDTSKMSREEGWRTDLQFLVREIQRRRYGRFSREAEADFDASVQKLNAAIPNLTEEQFELELTKLMRKVGDGHSGLLGGASHGTQTLPVQFYLFEEGLFIISADPKYKDLLGAQVLKIGEATIDKIIAGLDPLIQRDNQIWIKQIVPYQMRNPRLLKTLGFVNDPVKVPLLVRGIDNKERSVLIEADTSQTGIWNKLPNPPEWISYASTVSAPMPRYMKDLDANYRFEFLPEAKTVYFQFNRVIDDPKEPLASFSDRLFKFINQNEVEKLVIDLRWNNGGNTFLLTPLVQGLIKTDKINQRGKLFVIIGRRTFSAAQNAATFFERYTNAVFVGEPTGSSPNFVGEEKPFRLPYSKIVANVSDLYWESSFPQDRRTWIAPQIYAPPTFAAFRENRDAALEAILGIR